MTRSDSENSIISPGVSEIAHPEKSVYASAASVVGLPLDERQALQATARSRVGTALPAQPTGLNLWDTHNRITAAAQRFDFRRRTRLEQIGGATLLQGSVN